MNRYWKIFLLIVGLAAFWHSMKAAYELRWFYILSNSTHSTSMKIIPQEFSNERFGGKAFYTFVVNQQPYQGSVLLDDPVFRNREAMEQAIPNLEARPWKIWYEPSYPNNSALTKSFPTKEIVYSIILWCLLFYFVSLSYRKL